jgi:hypothetical protein
LNDGGESGIGVGQIWKLIQHDDQAWMAFGGASQIMK